MPPTSSAAPGPQGAPAAALTLRCTLTAERLDRAGPELAAALAGWTSLRQEALRPLRARTEPHLRAFGLAASALGALLSAFAVVVSPDRACGSPPGGVGPGALYQVTTPLFAVLGVVFWFLPRLSAELRAWAPGAAARQAPRLLSRLRPHLPSEVTYRLDGARIVSTLDRPRRSGRTRLSAVQGALVGREVACLFGRPLGRLLRVVWLAGEQEREALVAALRAAGVAVHDLPAAPAGAPAAGRG